MRQLLLLHLLGRHVGGEPIPVTWVVSDAGQRRAEIRDLDVGVLRQQDVGGLDIAMDDAVPWA